MIRFFVFFGAVLGATGSPARGAKPLALETVVNEYGRTGKFDTQHLEPKLKVLRKEEIEFETQNLRKHIEEINARLTTEEKNEIIQEADSMNPEGYMCENTIIEVKELQFTDQVRCYNTTEEVCSMVHETVFEEKEEKQCDTHFKKVCWIDYEDQATTETVRICNKKPQRVCNLSDEQKARVQVMKETKEHYETVCQTRYVEVKSTENKIDCHMVNKEMCMKDDDACEKGTDGCNCIPYQERECTDNEVEVIKQIPKTGCKQHKSEIEYDPLCPLVVENEVCSDVEKTFVQKKPVEVCEMEPREVCTTIVNQYPTLQMSQQCDFLPRETCTPERVQPQLVTKPVIKKLCMKIPADQVEQNTIAARGS